MNDDDLITTLREQRGTVPMTTPLEQIVSRGRAVRARRRAPMAAAALGTAGAAALAVGLALPAGHPASSSGTAPGAQLAAWSVTRQPGHTIRVNVRELRDPAGLQRRLRADGVPASVTFSGRANPACHGLNGGGTQAQRRHRLHSVASMTPAGHHHVLVIHPRALPSGRGIEIVSFFRPGTGAARLRDLSGPSAGQPALHGQLASRPSRGGASGRACGRGWRGGWCPGGGSGAGPGWRGRSWVSRCVPQNVRSGTPTSMITRCADARWRVVTPGREGVVAPRTEPVPLSLS